MESITQILNKYDTDKEWHHGYGKAYEGFFKDFDRNAELNILEIGTQKGGSLLAWKEYFPNAKVTGLDIVDIVSPEYKKDTVSRIITDVKDWRTDDKFDIVIDDGSHYLGDIVYVISYFLMKLNPNGILVIEDVRNPKLLHQVLIDLMKEFKLGHPDYDGKGSITLKFLDARKIGTESSYIICLSKSE